MCRVPCFVVHLEEYKMINVRHYQEGAEYKQYQESDRKAATGKIQSTVVTQHRGWRRDRRE